MPSRIIEKLKANTLYHFAMRAHNAAGWGTLSAEVDHTTLYDQAVPADLSAPTLLLSPGVFILRWTVSSDIAAKSYNIYIYTSNTPGSAKLLKRIAHPTNYAQIKIGEKTEDVSITVTSGTTYYFWMTAVDSSGNESTNKVATSPTNGFIEETMSRGGTVLLPTAAINIPVWRAPFACTVIAVKGYRVGGTGATINARLNGTSNHLSSDLSLTSADTWMDGGSVQNTAYAIGDKLEIMVVSVTGTPDQIAIQVDFSKP